ncbi:MAG: sodium/solute symporter [Planctomycetia bacterium]|nr:sodium/solute symporter [Planctomycetia bacterium]MCC7315210.1 sodium:solute symporter [Planctomycetota bacterium]OQZ06687.1 MAG: sodium transporter [Planctomycetes bacterium UTPLA1]
MASLDFVVLFVYFAAIAAISYWSSKKSLDSSENYFLSGRSVGWLAVGASLFASNISAEHFIGLAGSGASSGLAVGQFEWLACFILLLLGWFFVPFYLRLGVFTMPQFLERRYDSRCRTYLSMVSLVAYVFTKISVAVFAGALVLKEVLGWNIWAGAIVLVVATGIYTIFGGLRAVIYTELMQAFILIAGGIFLTFAAISKVDGLGALASGVEPEFFNLWKSVNHPDFPWTGILFGAPILGVWYWCTDQMIVQRTLAAKNVSEARRGTILAGFLKILPVFILVLPGVAGRILFPDTKPNDMYAKMVNDLLPVGVKGMVVAALLAALMSSLSAVFNSSSTLVVIDFYQRLRPRATERELVWAGQISTAVLVVVGLVWIPFIGVVSDQLFVYLQSVQAYISPPIAAVFLVGLIWRRANATGAFAALVIGFVLGAVRFVAELGVKSATPWVTWPPLVQFAQINFLHVAIILFVISVVVLVGISLVTAVPTATNQRVFDKTVAAAQDLRGAERNKVNVILSVILVVAVLAMWAYFSRLFFK